MKKQSPINATRLFALVFAVLFSLSSASHAFAAVNITNGDFETGHGCSLIGWTATTTGSPGDVGVVSGAALGFAYADSCVAKVSASKSIGYFTATSTLAQTFTVPTVPGPAYLQFDSWAQSSNPGAGALAQTINVYNSSGTLISSKTRNLDSTDVGKYVLDVDAYEGQDITLEIKVSVSGKPTASAALYLNNARVGGYYWDGRSGWSW